MHMIYVCEYRVIHNQCRCPSPNKTVQMVMCDSPGRHMEVDTGDPEYYSGVLPDMPPDPDEEGEEKYEGPVWDISPMDDMPSTYQDLLFLGLEMGVQLHEAALQLQNYGQTDGRREPLVAKTTIKGIEAPVYVVFAPTSVGPAPTWTPAFIVATNNLTNLMDVGFHDVVAQRAMTPGGDRTMKERIIEEIDERNEIDREDEE